MALDRSNDGSNALNFQLAKLESLAAYFDTDSTSMAGLPAMEATKKFSDMVRVFC